MGRKQNTPGTAKGSTKARVGPTSGTRPAWEWWLSPLLIAAGVVVYANSFGVPFLFDDQTHILNNPYIRQLWPVWQAVTPAPEADTGGRPLVNLSLAINYAIGGLQAVGYHVVNLVIHLAAALTLFGIVRRTLDGDRLRARYGPQAGWLAFAIALVWTVHPLQTQSVTYIIQRSESMMGLWYLLTLYSVIRGARSTHAAWWHVIAVGACALGMISKPVMVTAPLAALVYDVFFLSSSLREAFRRRGALYVGLAATWLLLIPAMAPLPDRPANVGFHFAGVTPTAYALMQPGVVLHYLRLALWPDALCFDYFGWPLPNTAEAVALPIAAMAALVGLTGWAFVHRSLWAFPGVWWFLILLPTSSVIPIADVAFEHRVYLPLASVAVCLVVVVWEGLRRAVPAGPLRRGLVAVLLLIVATALGCRTARRNMDYQSEAAIWQDVVTKRPTNSRAHSNLGKALVDAGRIEEGMAQLAEALRLDPDDPDANYNLANELLRRGKLAEAIERYQLALRGRPRLAQAHHNLGMALLNKGEVEGAIAHLSSALRIMPYSAKVHKNLGVALAKKGKVDEAVTHYQAALRLEPGYAEARELLDRARGQGGVDRSVGSLPQPSSSKSR